jgi:ABC-type uncharacterized transport system substrate-binding protein
MNRGLQVILGASIFLLLSFPVLGHPHVWVTVKAELVYAPDGSLSAIRHHWAFDDMFSAFATEGLKGSNNGKLTSTDLAPLAKVNIESLKEYSYFTRAIADGHKVAMVDPPPDYQADFNDGILTLNFTIPLKTPVRAKELRMEIYDPTFFVDFEVAESAPVKLVNAPAGCKLNVEPSKGMTANQSLSLGEQFFMALNAKSSFGEQFANKILVRCP